MPEKLYTKVYFSFIRRKGKTSDLVHLVELINNNAL